jgi:hypothetical protein
MTIKWILLRGITTALGGPVVFLPSNLASRYGFVCSLGNTGTLEIDLKEAARQVSIYSFRN